MRKFVLKKVVAIFVFSFLAGGWLMFVLYGRLPFFENNDTLKEPLISYKYDNKQGVSDQKTISVAPTKTPDPTNTSVPTKIPKNTATEKKPDISADIIEDKDVLLNVPFAAQAPLGNWADPMQQNGCEEISAIMAMAWVNGEQALAPEDTINEIRKISNYELENYGGYIDTDAEDMALRIFRGYYKFDNVEVRHNIGAEDIKQELFKGNLVIIPANGKILANPNYTPPGPQTHMLVIKGYDASKKEFITNDGGTRKGENFRYKENVVEEAILDYPTGNHEPITEIRTAMIIVKKK